MYSLSDIFSRTMYQTADALEWMNSAFYYIYIIMPCGKILPLNKCINAYGL